MNKQEEQRILDTAIAGNRIPRHVASGRTILKTYQGKNTYFVLENGSELTRAGEYWYNQTKQNKPNRFFDPNQEVTHRGDGDYIQTSTGVKRVRQLTANGQMRLTSLGKQFYKDRLTEYVIEIPVIIECLDSKGNKRVRRGEHLPVSELGIENIFKNDG